MKLTVKVERDGSETELRISPLAFIGWEKRTGRKMSDLAGGGMGMGDLALLAMEQEKLQGATVPENVEEWLANVEDLDPDVAGGPTPGGGDTSAGA